MRTKRIANVKKVIADFFSSMHYFKCGNEFSLKNKQLLKKTAIIPYILFFQLEIPILDGRRKHRTAKTTVKKKVYNLYKTCKMCIYQKAIKTTLIQCTQFQIQKSCRTSEKTRRKCSYNRRRSQNPIQDIGDFLDKKSRETNQKPLHFECIVIKNDVIFG